MGILKEDRKNGLPVKGIPPPPEVHCTVFKDNSGALELTRMLTEFQPQKDLSNPNPNG